MMFTVIICDEHIINDCHNKYNIYLKPFLSSEEFVFCKWDTTGETLDEAVPELKESIGSKSEWRAIIVNDNATWDFASVNKRNPFNYVDSKNNTITFEDSKKIEEFRLEKEGKLEKALKNPLAKLSFWLCGAPTDTQPGICYEGFEDVIENPSKEYFDKLAELNITANEVELDRLRLMRYTKISQKFGRGAELFNPPKTVLALAERTKDVMREVAESAWNSHMEFEYSQFYIENLYSDKLRYIIYDVSYLKGKHNEDQYFKFLTALLLLAVKETPSGVLRSNRVYSLNVKIDSDCVRELCNVYCSKLNATRNRITNESLALREKEHQPIDRDTAEFYFETGVTVPVSIDRYFDEENLMAEHKEIGLSTDCPGSEYGYWNKQYNSIEKLFIRYLREPRRAVKTAVKDKFRSMNKNTDERALQLSEFQKEDVQIFLEEEEETMVSTQTTHLYDTAIYKEQMEEADTEIRRGIGQRMTKKKTITVSLIAALAYLLGFIPLFLGNLNNVKSFMFSLGMTGITISIFLLIGFITLLVFRNRLINKFKHFNYVMSDILDEIHGSLSVFSSYLSSACNVMRGFSVLESTENAYKEKQNILNNHKKIILDKIKEVNELFAGYIDDDTIKADRMVAPYDFDFTQMREYQFDMPYYEVEKSIVFMQEGNEIPVPVDYLKEVTVEREELYD